MALVPLISIHALLAESDIGPQVVADRVGISIHALLAESDGHFADRHRQLYHFYPRSPCGERPGNDVSGNIVIAFLSTLSLRRATHKGTNTGTNISISIHALLAESDPVVTSTAGVATKFLSTLSLRRATQNPGEHYVAFRFLSTLSLRRATGSNQAIISKTNNFYPRSPCGERPIAGRITSNGTKISIHALLAESDVPSSLTTADCPYFYPRSPCGERL